MSLLLAIFIGIAIGAFDSFLFNKAKRILGSMVAGLIGAVMGLLVGFVISSGSADAMTITAYGALAAAIGALIASLLYNLIAHGYTDPNGPTELNNYDPDPK